MEHKKPKPPGPARWVVWLGIVVALLVVLAVGGMVLMPGQHGPGRHL